MAIQVQLANGSLVGGGGQTFKAAHVHLTPLEYGTLGHYRVVAAVGLLPNQAGPSRLFELRNAGGNLIVPTLVQVEVMASGDVSPDKAISISMSRCLNFTAVDTVDVFTPTVIPKRTSGMSAAPGGAQVRMLALSGAVAGMTGWTATKDSGAYGTMFAYMSSASADRPPRIARFISPEDVLSHPLVLQADQGIVIENGNLGSDASNAVVVTIHMDWAEVAAY